MTTEQTYRIGQIFRQKGSDCYYLLAQTKKQQVCLINISTLGKDANRWNRPEYVEDIRRITHDEMSDRVAEVASFKDVFEEVLEQDFINYLLTESKNS